MVASQNGYMYIYSIPLDGGECQLIKKHGKFKADSGSIKDDRDSAWLSFSYNFLSQNILKIYICRLEEHRPAINTNPASDSRSTSWIVANQRPRH